MSDTVLIQELIHNVEASGNRMLERRLADLAVWFYKNRNNLSNENLAGRLEFLMRAFWIMLEVNALLVSRVHSLEGRSDHLWLPRQVSVNGEVQRLR